jgi:predicted MPP superfamily phosphohydrolase
VAFSSTTVLKKKAIAWIVAVPVCIAMLIWSVFVEPAALVVKEYSIELPNWPKHLNGLKIAVLSDLHVGSLHIGPEKLRAIVDETNKQNADLILLLGDYVSAGRHTCLVKPATFVSQLARLKAKLGVYAILGNHDWWYNGEDVGSSLESANIRVLEDSTVMLQSDQTPFWLAGLKDLWTRNPNIESTLAPVNSSSPVIVMSHNPDVFPAIPERVALTIAGHTHGGQVSFPFIGPLIVPSEYGARFAKGVIIENEKHLFVSSGIGTSVLPIRFGVPPEISVLILSGKKDSHDSKNN